MGGGDRSNEQLPSLELGLFRIERDIDRFRSRDCDFEDFVGHVDDGGDEYELKRTERETKKGKLSST